MQPDSGGVTHVGPGAGLDGRRNGIHNARLQTLSRHFGALGGAPAEVPDVPEEAWGQVDEGWPDVKNLKGYQK